MKLRHLLLITALAAAPAFFTGCGKSQASETQKPEIVFSDTTVPDANGENVVAIDDSSLPDGELGIKASRSAGSSTATSGDDSSKISVMVDAYGNKSETRCFNNDPRVKCITIKTSLNGEAVVTVYGQNGVTKMISKDKLGSGLNASADEIADAAEFSEPSQKADISKMIKKKSDSVKLKPLPSSEFPIQPVQIPPPPVEANPPAAAQEEPVKSPEQISPYIENQSSFQ